MTDRETKLRRLQHLKTILQNVQDQKKNFFMGAWAAPIRDGIVDIFADLSSSSPVIHEPCGTAACALGYAAMDPQFFEEGLRLKYREADEILKIYNPRTDGTIYPWMAYPYFYHTGDSGYEAAIEFFGISHNQAHYLFDPEEYVPVDWDDDDGPVITAVDVIARVDEVIAQL